VAFALIPGDKRRRYRDSDTGEVIARRQYDKRFCRLAGEELSQDAIAKKNKRENPELAATRPARGRKKSDEEKALTKIKAKQREKNRRVFARQIEENTKEFKSKKGAQKKTAIVSLFDTDSVDDKGRIIDPEFILALLFSAKKKGFRIFSMLAEIDLENVGFRRKISGFITNPYPFKVKDKANVIESLQNMLLELLNEYDRFELVDLSLRFFS
jgi:hypothetical protein